MAATPGQASDSAMRDGGSGQIISEVVRFAKINPGGELRIRRCDLAGWEVSVNGQAAYVGQMAAFSNAEELLKWLSGTFNYSVSTPEN